MFSSGFHFVLDVQLSFRSCRTVYGHVNRLHFPEIWNAALFFLKSMADALALFFALVVFDMKRTCAIYIIGDQTMKGFKFSKNQTKIRFNTIMCSKNESTVEMFEKKNCPALLLIQ